MTIRKMLTLGLAVAISAAAALPAFAEDPKPAAPAAAPAAAAPAKAAEPAKPADAAKPADPAKKKAAPKPGQPKSEVKATVTGKIEVKQAKNKKTGKDQEVLVLTVATATGPDGKEMAVYKGKPLRVGGKKELNLKSYAGKDVTIDGKIINQRRLMVETIK